MKMSRIRIEKVSIMNTGTEYIVYAAIEQLQGGSGVCGAILGYWLEYTSGSM